ncbi:UNVERIFIED_CONTAM: hypothetical protein DV101_08535, partial [Bifidobacterium animalis]|nr:hypothetical protein [Bifidobacterium animalis]
MPGALFGGEMAGGRVGAHMRGWRKHPGRRKTPGAMVEGVFVGRTPRGEAVRHGETATHMVQLLLQQT